jgi:hypothetical protein
MSVIEYLNLYLNFSLETIGYDWGFLVTPLTQNELVIR